MNKRYVNFNDYLEENLKNPKFKKYFDEYGKQLKIAYQTLQMRKELDIEL